MSPSVVWVLRWAQTLKGTRVHWREVFNSEPAVHNWLTMMSKIKKAVTGVLFVILLLCLVVIFTTRQWKGRELERWEVGNGVFRVRVTSYEASSFLLSGMYYQIESSNEEGKWSAVLSFRDDDQRLIPRDQIKLLDSRIGYAYVGWVYAVTTDGAKTWSIWNAEKDLPDWQCCNYKLVKEVQLSADGNGKMILHPIPMRRGEVPELHTVDFGRHWSD